MGLEDVLANLRREYSPVVKATVGELEGAFSAARSGQGEWKAAWRIAHKLAGTSGSFGLAEVSRHARALEDALEAPHRDDAVLDALLDELRRVAAAL